MLTPMCPHTSSFWNMMKALNARKSKNRSVLFIFPYHPHLFWYRDVFFFLSFFCSYYYLCKIGWSTIVPLHFMVRLYRWLKPGQWLKHFGWKWKFKNELVGTLNWTLVHSECRRWTHLYGVLHCHLPKQPPASTDKHPGKLPAAHHGLLQHFPS